LIVEKQYAVEQNPGGSVKPTGNMTKALKIYRRSFGDHYNRYLFAKDLCKGKRIVDYGCGHGYSALILKNQYKQYVGVDLDKSAINWAKSNIGRYNSTTSFFTPDEFQNSFPDHFFDVALSFEVIEHLQDPLQMLKCLKQKVISQGKIVLSTPNGAFAKGDRNLFSSSLHINEFSAEEFYKILSKTGGMIRLYKQDRIDKLNRLWRQRFKAAEQKSTTNSTDSNSVFKIGSAAMSRGYKFISNYFNGPLFWHIASLDDKDLNSVGFSNIIAIVDLP
jgi:2-polyprenyl-3-methyl-5-hydroxy-6-metoxy-1,4-benzoquinol methylase